MFTIISFYISGPPQQKGGSTLKQLGGKHRSRRNHRTRAVTRNIDNTVINRRGGGSLVYVTNTAINFLSK